MTVVLAAILVSVALARLSGGRLLRLGDLRLHAVPVLAAGGTLQALVLSEMPPGMPTLYPWLHVLSYACAGWFFLANRALPGLWLVGFGGLLNFAAIAVNGGVMPAAPAALAAAGLAPSQHGFTNSAALADPRLAFLGDVFALRGASPLATVFSFGDVVIVVGVAYALYRICGARPAPNILRNFATLRAHPRFARLWGAQAASNVGDFMYALAVATSVAGDHDAAFVLAALLLVQTAGGVVTGILAGAVVDRLRRVPLMLVADVVRFLAVMSLVLGDPSRPHLYAVALCLGVFGALFQPAFYATVPNVVRRDEVVSANALLAATYHVAIMCGPVAAGLIVARWGQQPVFLVNAASFAVSALLIAGLRGVEGAVQPSSAERPLRAVADGLRYAASHPVARPLFVVVACVMFAAALKMPLEAVFVLRTLQAGPAGLGLSETVWGAGMLAGALITPALARRLSRAAMLSASIALTGATLVAASRASTLAPVLLLWVLAGGGNALGTIVWDSWLQEEVPDSHRGRALAAFQAVLHSALLVGALVAVWLSSRLDVRVIYLAAGALMLVTAVVAIRLLPRPSRRTLTLPAATAVPQASASAGG